MSRVTSFDVAKLAGVSQPTVSRALRNMPGVSPATRAAVLAAARELSYIASDRGRSLATSATNRVAVVSAELTNPYYPELVDPIRRELDARGYRTVVIADRDDQEVALDALADGSYDGVILTTVTRESTLPRDLTERGVPHVLTNRLLDSPESPSVGIDNVAGARLAAQLLADLGHRRIGLVSGPINTSTGRERAHGARAGLRAHGLALKRELIRRCPFNHDAAMRRVEELLALSEPPTAILCGNDVIALGALSAAREARVSVPGQLSIVGFDDIPMASWPLVGLTTVHCDLGELARHSVDLLMARIGGDDQSLRVMRLAPTLVLRRTHGPPRSE